MTRLLFACALAFAGAALAQSPLQYSGADRERYLLREARKEGEVAVHAWRKLWNEIVLGQPR